MVSDEVILNANKTMGDLASGDYTKFKEMTDGEPFSL